MGHLFADGGSPADAWSDCFRTVVDDNNDQTFLLVSAEEGALPAGEVPRDGPFPDGWLESTYQSSGDALMFDYSQVTGGSALKSPTVGKKGEDGSAITAFGGTPPVNLDVAEDAIAHPEPPLLRYLHF